ncbi:MAG TPA: lysophospholipid acyltransferase family protein [Pyrinomonadaceae bacterium]|nr:lysophospholipid acyltransferase family protein [Pyrinomonadaceae bacterium]
MITDKKKIKNTEIYQPASLSAYSLKQRIIIRLADFAFYILISLIGKTLRYETEGWENFEVIEQAGKIPIYSFWHNRIFAGTYFFRNRGIVVITSQSFDGEYIARFIQRFGYGAIRGSSTRGGVKALVEMIRGMREGLPMAFTVDGPKGPKYVAKSGACLLAKKTENPLMPFSVECNKFWTVKSWDDLQIPKPFSRVRVIISAPVYVSKNADQEEIEKKCKELQSKLDETVLIGQQWREINS